MSACGRTSTGLQLARLRFIGARRWGETSTGGRGTAASSSPRPSATNSNRRRRAEPRRSLDNPHPESAELAGQGLEEWTRGLPQEDAEALVDSNAGKPVRWVSGEGWV